MNNRLTNREIKDKMHRFLFSKKNGNALLFIFFFALSAGFWLLQKLNEDYETEISIPLQLKNVPDNVVITTDLPDHLRITVKDKGTVLVKYLFGQSFLPIKVNYANYQSDNGHVVFRSADLQRYVLAQLASSTKLSAIKPDTLEYYFNLGESKRVPVRLRGRILTGPQYYISRMLFEPDSVTVYATEDILDTLYAVYTMPVHHTDVSDTLRFTVPLRRMRGVKIVPPMVRCTVFPDIFTEKTVNVPVVGVNFPADRKLRTFPSQVQITFRVGMSQFKRITSDDFVLSVTYDELQRSGSTKCHLRLKSIPQGASHVRISPSDVDYLIEQIPEGAND
jgi:hypothetical protein